MTKKRKIRSTLPSEPKPQLTRVVLSLALGLVITIGLAGVTRAQTEVYPTGNAADDVPNVQAAVDLGGTVLLKATPTYFNFEGGIVEINNDVVILGEPGSISLPDGRMADRTTIYGGGGAGFPGYGDTRPINRAGAFMVLGGNFEISGLWFDSSSFASIFVRGCNGARISDNVITYIKAVPDGWRSWAKGIVFAEWDSDQIFGEIVVAHNTIKHNPNPPYQIRNPEGITVIRITSDPMPDISIIGNTIEHPGGWNEGRTPTGILSWHPVLIKDNTITGNWNQCIYAEGVVVWDPPNIVLTGSVVERNTVSGAWGNAIGIGWCDGSIVAGNTILDTSRRGLHVYAALNVIVEDNTFDGFTGTIGWSSVICVERSNSCTVAGNTLIDVNHGPMLAGVRISSYRASWWPLCANNTVQGNNYKHSDLPGWNENHPDGPGAVLLQPGPGNNTVDETAKRFPPGTTICEQILDMTATPENPDGDNTEVGMERCPEVSDYIDRLRDQAERDREE